MAQMSSTTPLHIYFFLLIELIFVAYLDIKYKKIKNHWSLLNLVVGVILFIYYSDIYPFSIDSFQLPIVFIFVGFVLFMLKIMGGGDSKLLATFFLLVPLNQQEIVFYYLLINTVIIGSTVFLKNVVVNFNTIIKGFRENDLQSIKSCFGRKFPYAPVILFTWIWYGIQNYLF